jgi:hypothetical protein
MGARTIRWTRRFRAAAAAALLLSTAAAGGGAPPSPERPDPPAVGSVPVGLGLAGLVNSGASVAAAGSRVVVAWAARSESQADVYAALSRDGGSSFEAPIRVNDLPGDARVSGEQAPRVVLDEAMQVAWVSRQDGMSVIRTARSRPGDRSFAPAKTVHAAGLTGARGWASLAEGGDGAVHVAWLDGRGEAPSPRSSPRPAEAAGAHNHRTPMRQDLFQAVWRADGTHDEARVATNVCFCCKTAVGTGPDGSVYVAWRHIYAPNLRDIGVARSVDGGRTFSAPVRVSEDGWAIDGCPDDGPSIGIDARGVVHVVWPTLVPGGGGKGIFYSYSLDGGRSFAPRLRLDEGLGGAAHPQMAVAGGRVVVVWDQGGVGARRVSLREIVGDPQAAAWSPRMGAATTLSNEAAAVYPAVAATAAGTVVAWTEESAAGSVIRVRRGLR